MLRMQIFNFLGEKLEKLGYRFSPTDEELMNYFLMNQNVGNTKQVEETISEINFYDYDPVSLPPLSKTQADNRIYYFFAPNSNRKYRKRSSEYGEWKPSGDVTEIKDENGEKIGDKMVLVYQKKGAPKPNGIESHWVMHEYQISDSQYDNLSFNLDTNVICKVFDMREDANIRDGNKSSEPTHHPQVSESKISLSPKVDEQEIYGLYFDDSITPMNIDKEPIMSFLVD